MDALEAYFTELSANRLAGSVPETSGYGALAVLLNDVGGKLRPKVRCVINPANRGAGIPDGGFFTANQFQKGKGEPLPGQLPARGALEVKPVGDDVYVVARSEQVLRYLEKYGQVLVTTYREFVLVGYDADGAPRLLESYTLAATELGFWTMATTPRKSATEHGERLADFLRRALLRGAPIASPQDLAWFLASYAREARSRAEERELPALATTRAALEESLGMTFSGEKGDHFFRSTLVQTLFYGLFAAWVFWAEHHPPSDTAARFRWREAAQYLHIPILQKLFYDFANPSQLGALRLDEVLDWAGEALNRVDRASFFATFAQQHAVQYFYEPFLEAFDPQLRKELGVWYTPPEIVAYMVARVDAVLRSELDIADGLADPRVVVLDPCCGTGAYLVEVLERIAATLREKGDDALLANDLKQAAMSRVFGFEILPAPFVISHLQIGMLLHRLGAPFADTSSERAGVYLTNALTGWEPPAEPKQHLLFHEMEEERDRAAAVKQHAPILVILGNPPYNGFAGAAVQEERDLVEAYRQVKNVAPPQGQGLNDLYVRFFRMAERRISEGPEERGIVCFISNYAWLDHLSFSGMREKYIDAFDHIWIDCLNGDKFKTGKLTPDGEPDPSVFSTEKNREGIQVGTAITVLARTCPHIPAAAVNYRDFWGEDKNQELLNSCHPRSGDYVALKPAPEMGLPFLPALVQGGYFDWPRVADLFTVQYPGVITSRDDFVVGTDLDELMQRLLAYFDASVPDGVIAKVAPSAVTKASRFDPGATRSTLVKRGLLPDNVVRYQYRPFDVRWLYWEPQTKLLHEKREEYFASLRPENRYLFTTSRTRKSVPEPALLTSLLTDFNCQDSGARGIPLLRHAGGSLLESGGELQNLAAAASRYIRLVDATALDLLVHILTTTHSGLYRRDHAAALRHDWPRIPLPAGRDALLASAKLGGRVAALLDVEEPVEGVTTGSLRFELRPLGPVATANGRQLDPASGDLAVSARWGIRGKGGITMPGKGRIEERPYAAEEQAQLREGAAALGLSYDQLLTCLGETACDVFLNEHAYWRCVPSRAWKYTIGGYQVIKKWLSYRERALLRRDLKPEEARYVTEMVRRISAILLLEPALDANYERVKADTYDWPGGPR